MTKPLPTGSIKDRDDVSWITFNKLFESVSFDDTIDHLYIVDIEFDFKNATDREYTYNDIYPPIIEKQRIIDPCERSAFQLIEQFIMGKTNLPKANRSTAKAHANLFQKKFLPMYLEDLVFCVKRAGWKVTKIHAHLTFKQKRFKQKFILMNQKLRQESNNSIEKDFYKLMNNSNFGYGCRNNLDNWKFVPIFDEYQEITFLGRYCIRFDPKVRQFVTSDLLKQDIEAKFNDKLSKLDKQDAFYEIKLQTIKNERLQQIESAERFEQQQKKNKKRMKLIDFVDRKNEAFIDQKVKSLIDFDEEYSASIRSVSIKKNNQVKLTTRILSGKMLMFSKVSIKSFLYDLIDVFMSPNQEIREIYQKYQVEKCYLYQNLTDTDSTSIFFVFICDLNCSVRKEKARNIIFEVLLKSKVFDCLDLSAEFYD